MPRILRIINRLNIGGPTYNVSLLSKYLSPEYETKLVGGMKSDTEASSEFIVQQLGLNPTYIPDMYRSINPVKDWKAFHQIKQLIKAYKPDIVHTHAAKAGALGRLAAYQCGVPIIVHTFHGHVFHSYFNPIKTRFFLEIERRLAKISNRIIAISPKQKAELGDIYTICENEKIETIPLGFDLSRFQDEQINKRIEFRQKYQIADDEVAIGIVGRIVPIKNHALFLQALKQLCEKTTTKIRAFIVGDGEERSNIEELAKSLNIPFADNETAQQQPVTLTFTSWIKKVDEVYAGLDVVALSSLNEGTPVSLIEAQAANKPIVTTNVGGVADVTIPNQTALLSPSKDVDAFAQNLLQLVDNKEFRLQMGKEGYDFVKQKYCYTRLVRDMDSLYQQLIWETSPTKIYQVAPAPQVTVPSAAQILLKQSVAETPTPIVLRSK